MNILAALVNTYSLHALNLSCLCFYKNHNQIEFAYILESAYFLIIFSSHLLDKLLHANYDLYCSQRGTYATLISMLLAWLRHSMQHVKFYTLELQICDTVLLPPFVLLFNALQYVLLFTPKPLRCQRQYFPSTGY